MINGFIEPVKAGVVMAAALPAQGRVTGPPWARESVLAGGGFL